MSRFTFSEGQGSGSGGIGYDGYNSAPTGMLVILNRWHEYTVPGTTLLTIMFGNFSKNIDCVDDGFGNLVALDTYKQYLRNSTRDD